MIHGTNRAVFIDRDGVINVDKGYVYREEDLDLIEGAAAGIRLLNQNGLRVIVVTNQSGVARGLYAEDDVRQFHAYLQTALRDEGAEVDRFYYCPHHPRGPVEAYRQACGCRKPAPGLILRAVEDFDLKPASCYVVGNEARDVEAGLRAGCREGFLVSPKGVEKPTALADGRVTVVASLAEAACRIMAES